MTVDIRTIVTTSQFSSGQFGSVPEMWTSLYIYTYNKKLKTYSNIDALITLSSSAVVTFKCSKGSQTLNVIHSVTVALVTTIVTTTVNITKKLIRRRDSERERQTFLRRHRQPPLHSAPRKPPEFGEITQNKGHYAIQGHSRPPMLVLIESSCATSCFWLILTYLLYCTVSGI